MVDGSDGELGVWVVGADLRVYAMGSGVTNLFSTLECERLLLVLGTANLILVLLFLAVVGLGWRVGSVGGGGGCESVCNGQWCHKPFQHVVVRASAS